MVAFPIPVMSFPMKTKEISFHGKKFSIAYTEDYPQHPSWWMFEDEATVRNSLWNVTDNDCVFDVGSACGSYALPALACGASKVYAWSPQDQSGLSTSGQKSNGIADKDYLSHSLKLNGWSDRCDIYPTGIYDQKGWLDTVTQQFSMDKPNSPDSILVDTLDNWYTSIFLDSHRPKSFGRYWLKIDVEGAEVHVLAGAKRLISELRPNILVENHLFKDGNIEQKVRDHVGTFGSYREVSTTQYHSVSHSLYTFVNY